MDSSANRDRRRKRSSVKEEIIDEEESTNQLKSVKKEVNAPKRRRNDAIDVNDDEEIERHSTVSSVMAEPVRPSAEVLELRQSLLMSRQEKVNIEQHLINASQQLINTEQEMARKEGIFQHALREAESRAERAEKLLGSMEGVRDETKERELEEQVADLTKQLEKKDKRVTKLEEEKKGADEKVSDLTDKLEKEKRRSTMKITDLTDQLEEEKSKRRRADERIVQLTCQLAERKVSPQVQQTTAAAVAVGTKPFIHTFAHPNNILLLVKTGSNKTVSFSRAHRRLRVSLDKYGEENFARDYERKQIDFNCEVCAITLHNKSSTLSHFFSEGHIEKVRAHGGGVSNEAVCNWLNMLNQSGAAAKRREAKGKKQ